MSSRSFSFNGVNIKVIALADIVIPKYQRAANYNRINRIAAKFSFAIAGTIRVEPNENRTYDVVDGQHRFLAAKKWCAVNKIDPEDQGIPVQIVNGGHRDFVNCNKEVQQVNKNEEFFANWQGGDELETYVARRLQRAGLVIVNGGRGRSATGKIKATYNVFEIYRDFGKRKGNKVLGILSDHFARPEGDIIEPSAVSYDFLRGMYEWIKTNGDLDGLNVALRKSKLSAADICKNADMASVGRHGIHKQFAKQLEKIYKKG